jgi:hypothetical protein
MAIRIGQAKIHNDAWRCCCDVAVRGAWASFLNLTAARVMCFAALHESGCAGGRNG